MFDSFKVIRTVMFVGLLKVEYFDCTLAETVQNY